METKDLRGYQSAYPCWTSRNKSSCVTGEGTGSVFATTFANFCGALGEQKPRTEFFFFFLKFVMEGLDKHFMVDVFIQTETKKNWTACFFFI